MYLRSDQIIGIKKPLNEFFSNNNLQSEMYEVYLKNGDDAKLSFNIFIDTLHNDVDTMRNFLSSYLFNVEDKTIIPLISFSYEDESIVMGDFPDYVKNFKNIDEFCNSIIANINKLFKSEYTIDDISFPYYEYFVEEDYYPNF